MDAEIIRLMVPSAFGLMAAILTFARRFHNNDRDAGIGIAGWGLVGTFILSMLALFP
jgi:hypothetical protein